MIRTSNPPHYLIVAGDFVRTGGMDRANLALADYLANSSQPCIRVHLVAHSADQSLINHPNILFHQVPKPLKKHALGQPLLNLYGRSIASGYQAQKTLKMVVNGGNCRSDHVSINWAHYVHGAWSPVTIQTKKTDLVRNIRQNLSHLASIRHERIAFQKAPVIIANSRLTAAQISNLYQIDPSRIHVVYYGTDPSQFKPVTDQERQQARAKLGLNDDLPVITFVGALGDLRKGFDILFDAWQKLDQKRGWDAHLLVIGSGSLISYYKSRCDTGSKHQRIQFLGFRNDVHTILAASSLLVSPTRYEAYGLNVHEALCRNIPVLVSKSAGVAERIPTPTEADPVDMRFDDGICPDQLALRLEHWRDHQPQYAEKAEQAGSILRQHSWPERMAEWISCDSGS